MRAWPLSWLNPASSQNSSEIESVSFEYRSVALVRPWFRPEALVSRIWRSSHPELMLSDGADPARGRCPAYASACVFVRNISVVEKSVKSTQSEISRDLRFTLDPRRLTQRNLSLDSDQLTRITNWRNIGTGVTGRRPEFHSLKASGALEGKSFTAVAAPSFRLNTAKHVTRVSTVPPRPYVATSVNANLWSSPEQLTTPPQPPTMSINSDEMSILAFICKRLPKTPDPAPELHWD